ncbi:MAG: DNA mismatch repair endonuclease MutL [Candidatus Odinarchaeota archaeon]
MNDQINTNGIKKSSPSKISRLPEDLINRIAAGEVVERPASVVKELIENAIDANADRINIDLENGGKKLVRVSDNGTGMTREDVSLCLERHSTSKIRSDEDLEQVLSLGFRGEFLASVSAVSKITIKSKDSSSPIGSLLKSTPVAGKLKKELSDIQMNTGTVVEVLDLFFNVPVRAKFLKATKTELARVTDTVRSFILSHENISFTFRSDNKLIYQTGISSGIDRLAIIMGKELAKRMLEVIYESADWKIKGFISKPIDRRKSKEQIFVFLNGRRIKNKLFINAIEEVYHTLLFKGEYPVVVLHLTTDPHNYDPNVHPTKREVRIYNEAALMDILKEALLTPLKTAKLVKQRDKTVIEPLGSFSPPAEELKATPSIKVKQPLIDGREEKVQITRVATQRDSKIKTSAIQPKFSSSSKMEVDHLLAKGAISALDIIGQHLETYIIACLNEDLFIIDQHAADERINYETILKSIKNAKTVRQKLLQPLLINLTASEVTTAMSYKDKLQQAGFEIEQFGIDTIKVITMPVIKGKEAPKEAVIELISKIGALKLPEDEFTEHVAAALACHKSFRGGDYLTEPAMKGLLKRLSETDMPFTCPHGRPTIIRVSENQLKKIFKR